MNPELKQVQVETLLGCNRSCVFCPTKATTPKEFMALEIYRSIIDQLSDLKFSGRISPYWTNEPLLDKRIPDLLAYARQRCPDSWLTLNTNGDALSIKLGVKLFEAGLNVLEINAYDDQQQHKNHVALAGELNRLISAEISASDGFDGFGQFKRFNYVKLPRSSRQVHCNDMSTWSEKFQRKQPILFLLNRAGNTEGARKIVEPLKLGCELPSEHMIINYRGDVVLCNADWRYEVIMGNILTAPLLDIWHGEKYTQYRERLADQDRSLPLCDRCDRCAPPNAWE